MSTSVQRSRVDEEDDLDDLDDVLDQFQPPSTSANAPTSASAQSPQPQPSGPETDEALTDELANELAKQMESLFTGIGDPSSPHAEGEGHARSPEQERLAAAWEAMLVEEMNSMSGPSTSNARTSVGASSSRPTGATSNFQSRIRSTVDRLRESESDLQPPGSSATAGAGTDSLESLLAGLGVGDAQNEEDFKAILERMMSQLMSKDVLYEPLKELHEKFPAYLAKHASTLSPEERRGYEAQIVCIKRLIDAFEAETYRDDDENARGRIVELMGELQTHGQPPEEIMGPLPPGFNFGVDGLPDIPEGCNMN